MLSYALAFLIAGALNLAGESAIAVRISWILFLIGIVLVAMYVFKREALKHSDRSRRQAE